MRAEDVVREIENLFERRGREAYLGEPVSQLDHALQAALFAEIERAPDALIVAALLHDIGHLLHSEGDDAADRGVDAAHEVIGARWLSQRFPPEVTRPIEMHVAAKRYLCGADSDYRHELSEASQRSLELQGGPMTKEARLAFETEPFFREAIQLRRWDDAAKVKGVVGLELSGYLRRILLEARRVETFD